MFNFSLKIVCTFSINVCNISKYINENDNVWGCTVENVDWDSLGFPSRNLEVLSIFSGFFYDFDNSSQNLDSLITCLDFNDTVSTLLKNAQSPDLQIFAASAPIEMKDLLKERKYRIYSKKDTESLEIMNNTTFNKNFHQNIDILNDKWTIVFYNLISHPY